MRTVGQVLAAKRVEKNLSLQEVEREIRIRKNVIKNIEESNWIALPSPTHVKGFIKNYGRYLGLDTNELLALYRREVDEKSASHPRSIFRTRLFRSFGIKPQIIAASLIGLIVLGFFGYLYREYRSFIAPPYLQVLEPGDNVKVTSGQINVVGNTDTEAVLKINGQMVDLSPGGTFSVAINLPEGKSALLITSENRFGGISRVRREVTVQLSQTEAKVATTSAQIVLPTAGVQISIKIGPNPAKIHIESDIKQNNFDGVLLSGTSRDISGNQSVRIRTSNAGSTTIINKGKQEVMGRENETKEVEIKP